YLTPTTPPALTNQPANPATTTHLITTLRQHLTDHLPDHLHPASIIPLTHIPLTPNGKTDHQALPAPSTTTSSDGRPPSTPREEILCTLFADVLGLTRVTIDDNFFHLGGHSLLATRLISRIRTTLGVDLPLRVLFGHPTVAELAPLLEGDDGDDRALDVLLPLRPGGTLPPLFCVHPGSGMCWSYAGLLPHLSADFPVYGLQSHALMHPDEIRQSVEEVAEDCVAAMKRVQPHGPYYLLGHSFGGTVAHAMAALLHRNGERVELIVSLDAEPARHIKEEEWDVLTDTGRMYAEMLELFGVDPRDIPGSSLTYQQFAEVARTTTAALGSLSEEEMTTMLTLVQHNGQISTAYRHERVPTNMLVLAASNKTTPLLTPDLWRPYVVGDITHEWVDCKHGTIVTPKVLRRLGPVIEARLREALRGTASHEFQVSEASDESERS
ncbi:alpha/beta fold hydrolase, partial [Streptomyces sp. 6N223]|uniref:alpha/beta fold hydrolase n=1 Tax=Streptomyces sp. 6N223 TaxID=3457412 RepID=UPI003FD3E3EC